MVVDGFDNSDRDGKFELLVIGFSLFVLSDSFLLGVRRACVNWGIMQAGVYTLLFGFFSVEERDKE